MLLTVNWPARGATYFASKTRGDVAAFVDLDFGEGPWSDLVRAAPRAFEIYVDWDHDHDHDHNDDDDGQVSSPLSHRRCRCRRWSPVATWWSPESFRTSWWRPEIAKLYAWRYRGLLGSLSAVSGLPPAVTAAAAAAAAAASGAGAEGGALTTAAAAVGQWPNMCVSLFVLLVSPPHALTLSHSHVRPCQPNTSQLHTCCFIHAFYPPPFLPICAGMGPRTRALRTRFS